MQAKTQTAEGETQTFGLGSGYERRVTWHGVENGPKDENGRNGRKMEHCPWPDMRKNDPKWEKPGFGIIFPCLAIFPIFSLCMANSMALGPLSILRQAT